MPSPFVKELKQFALTVDIVNEDVLRQTESLLKNYFEESLNVSAYEIRISASSGTQGERYLSTLWSCSGKKFTTPLFYDDGSVRGHTSYAVLNDKPLWIVSEDKSYLQPGGEYRELWSNVDDLPEYREWPDSRFRTSIIVPLGSPSIGFLNLEFDDEFEPIESAKEELSEIAEAITILCQLCDTYRLQIENTQRAVKNIDTAIPRNPLFKPSIFFAFSSQADLEVVGIIKDAIASCSATLNVVNWDEMYDSGNVHAHMREAIISAEYGICYFSQPDLQSNLFVDNPNVIFEAGMFHALTSSVDGKSRWIPIREENSSAPPFDFAADRLLNVHRDSTGKLNSQAFRAEIAKRLEALLLV